MLTLRFETTNNGPNNKLCYNYRSSVAFIAKKGRPAETQMVQLPRKQGPAKLRHVLQE